MNSNDNCSGGTITTTTTTATNDERHPINPPSIPFNFAPLTSSPDCLVFGCQRPGAVDELSSPGAISKSDVNKWAAFAVKEKGISRSLCLLNDTEVGFYASPGYKRMLEEENVKVVTMCNLSKPGAKGIALDALRDAHNNNEKIAVHCSGGEGRTGVILGLWVVVCSSSETSGQMLMSPENASEFVLEEAKKFNAVRKPNVHKIKTLIEKGYLP